MPYRRASAVFAALLPLLAAAGCAHWQPGDIDDIALSGRVLVEWNREDKFIYRPTGRQALSFKPSFMTTPIVPEDMYTDGGSVPRVFWSVPGLSPWGVGPAYIIHDWIFEVHRCNRAAPPEVKAITFDQSAQILAEVGKALVAAKLIDHNLLPQIVWAVRTRYARSLWNQPGDEKACAVPKPAVQLTQKQKDQLVTVVDFVIPQPAAR